MKKIRVLQNSAAAFVVLFLGQSQAATLTWDSNGTTGPNPFDGANTWDLTTARWWNGTADVIWDNLANNTALFGPSATIPSGMPGAVAVSTAITVGGLQFESYVDNAAKYNLNGAGTLTLAGAGAAITLNTTWVRPYAAINAILAGTDGITVNGNGNGILEFTKNFQFDSGSDAFGVALMGGPNAVGACNVDITNTAGVTISGAFNVTAAYSIPPSFSPQI